MLCLQDDIADRVAHDAERRDAPNCVIGNPDRLSIDVGPVITAEAQQRHRSTHIDAMRARRPPRCYQAAAAGRDASTAPSCRPRSSRSSRVATCSAKCSAPSCTCCATAASDLDALIDAINATGYGLTFGVHSRIDETIARVDGARSHAGNIYVNRNIIGAVVGVQPFGGHGLSGTGPKAGGPLYLQRLLSQRPPFEAPSRELAGPVGERNSYGRRPKGTILCVAGDPAQLEAQRAAALGSGNQATTDPADRHIAAVLFAGSEGELRALAERMAARDGPIVPVYVEPYPLEFLSNEVSLSVNTAAAGGNASLMAIG